MGIKYYKILRGCLYYLLSPVIISLDSGYCFFSPFAVRYHCKIVQVSPRPTQNSVLCLLILQPLQTHSCSLFLLCADSQFLDLTIPLPFLNLTPNFPSPPPHPPAPIHLPQWWQSSISGNDVVVFALVIQSTLPDVF